MTSQLLRTAVVLYATIYFTQLPDSLKFQIGKTSIEWVLPVCWERYFFCSYIIVWLKTYPVKVPLEFGEIPNFGRQAEQAAKLTYMTLYFHIKIQQCVFSILHQSV